jgi:mRNA interferase RelE/StbE
MYSILYSTAVKKDLKSLPKKVQDKIFESFKEIQKNPRIAKKLQGGFSDCYSYSFVMNRTDYRIIYTIRDHELIIIVVMIGSRENIYKKLKRRV